MTPICDFLFASTQTVHGGSEVLWMETACKLARQGLSVRALLHRSLLGSAVAHRMEEARVHLLPWHNPVPTRAMQLVNALLPRLRRFAPRDPAELQLYSSPARLTVINQGGNTEGGPWAGKLRAWSRPYVLLSHCANPWTWPTPHVWRDAREACLGARACAFVSAANRSLTERQLGLAFDRVRIVRNPLNTRSAGPLAWPEPASPWRLACVGRLYPEHKGQDLLLAVLGRAEWRARDIQVSFYGTGDGKESLRALAGSLRLTSVQWRGVVSSADEIWRDHHALVQASRAEGLSLALLEAMWCGRPPIATAVGGTAEVVKEGESGWMAEAPLEDALAAALTRAWQSRARAPEFGQAAAIAARSWNGTDPVGDFTAWLTEISHG